MSDKCDNVCGNVLKLAHSHTKAGWFECSHSEKKYPVFRGIYTDDMPDTGLSGKFCKGKMEKLTF